MSERKIEVSKPMKAARMENCVQVSATSGGRKTRWTVCAIGRLGEPAALSVHRRGRVGGARSYDKTPGGMTACSASGEASKCVIARHGVVLYPGGGTKFRKKGIPVYSGIKRGKKRRKSRSRKGGR